MRHDNTRSYPAADPALLSERGIVSLGRIAVDPEHITVGPPPDYAEGPMVVRGHIRLALLMCDAKIAANPGLVDEQLAELEAMSDHAEREAANRWRSEFSDQLADHQDLRAALEVGPERVFDRAQLTASQRAVMRQVLAGEAPAEIARSLGMDPKTVRSCRDRAIERIKAVDEAQELAS